jgi:hypothetical protein
VPFRTNAPDVHEYVWVWIVWCKFACIHFGKFNMKKSIGKYSLALSAISLAVLALPARAVEVSFSGSNIATTGMVSGADNLGNTWVTSDGPSHLNSSFTMANQAEASQAFNSANFVNGLGDWANSFQLTINKSQQGSGFKGILQTPVASGLSNEFMVQQ